MAELASITAVVLVDSSSVIVDVGTIGSVETVAVGVAIAVNPGIKLEAGLVLVELEVEASTVEIKLEVVSVLVEPIVEASSVQVLVASVALVVIDANVVVAKLEKLPFDPRTSDLIKMLEVATVEEMSVELEVQIVLVTVTIEVMVEVSSAEVVVVSVVVVSEAAVLSEAAVIEPTLALAARSVLVDAMVNVAALVDELEKLFEIDEALTKPGARVMAAAKLEIIVLESSSVAVVAVGTKSAVLIEDPRRSSDGLAVAVSIEKVATSLIVVMLSATTSTFVASF